MLGDYQKYEVTVKFTFEAEVFPEDPDDVYELAELEKHSALSALETSFPGLTVEKISVEPVIGEQ